MLVPGQRLVVGAGLTAAAVAVYHVQSQPESYHLLQTLPRTGRLLSWAAAAYFRYHAELAARGHPSELAATTLSNLQRVNARELAEVRPRSIPYLSGHFIPVEQSTSRCAGMQMQWGDIYQGCTVCIQHSHSTNGVSRRAGCSP